MNGFRMPEIPQLRNTGESPLEFICLIPAPQAP